MVDLRSNPMPLEPLHKWLSNQFHDTMFFLSARLKERSM